MYVLLWVHPPDSGSPRPGHMGAHLGSRIHVPVEAFLSLWSSDGWQLPPPPDRTSCWSTAG